jgi:hypothetical protein
MATITVIRQPIDGLGLRTGDYLIRLLQQEPRYDHLRIAVAFAKATGVAHLSQGLQQFRNSGGIIDVSVGIDHQNTSQEGLALLLQLADHVYIFHNPGPDTFHPKIYLFERTGQAATLISGSSNLTAGGLYTNYEMNIMAELDLAVPEDMATYQALSEYLDTLMNPTSGNVALLDSTLLSELVQSRWVVNETPSTVATRTVPRAPAGSRASHLFRRVPPPRPPTIVPSAIPTAAPIPPAITTVGDTFVMVLDNRDTRQRVGYSREIYIPLGARSARPDFWAWQNAFSPGATGVLERRVDLLANMATGETKRLSDRRLWDYPRKGEFRLNCGELITGAQAGDLLVLQLALQGSGYDYEASIIRRRHPLFNSYRRICVTRAPGRSAKYWGYA